MALKKYILTEAFMCTPTFSTELSFPVDSWSNPGCWKAYNTEVLSWLWSVCISKHTKCLLWLFLGTSHAPLSWINRLQKAFKPRVKHNFWDGKQYCCKRFWLSLYGNINVCHRKWTWKYVTSTEAVNLLNQRNVKVPAAFFSLKKKRKQKTNKPLPTEEYRK